MTLSQTLRRFAITLALAVFTLTVGVTAERTPVVHAANYPVTTLADSGPGSLREAIASANGAIGADIITFASGCV